MKNQQFDKYFLSSTKSNKRPIEKALRSRKYKITDERSIEYDSPTGKAYVGVAKTPFMPATANGFGYQGVLIQTDNRTLIQCHECGKWMKKNTNLHLRLHDLNDKEYKEKYGLYAGKGLVADATSYKLEECARKSLSSQGQEWLKRMHEYRKEGLAASRKVRVATTTDEYKNDHNTCEEQMKFRIIRYMKQFKQLPGTSGKGDGKRISKVLFRRYGSRNKGFAHYGLPSQYRTGTNVELKAVNGKQLFFNYNRNYNRDNVYSWIVENSELLK